ncbi:hypothetical protein MVEN_00967300 [Mycena venus]|uniref:Uncharacterized protein n=1 Tax=Mycena venus TaxID=2733690 RepID=A0A8H7CZV2_9AGAR|nr:hypothetical protein MVEN_00967300 [Mycena venus]
MSDAQSTYFSLPSSWILCFTTAALSLIPTNVFRYGSIVVVLASFGIHAARHIRPSVRLEELNDKVKAATDLLSHARSQCPRNIFEFDEIHCDLLQATLSTSIIRSDLLEACDVSWKIYFQKMKAVWRELNQCERQVRKIRTLTLLTIESEIQRRLAQDIQESRDISAVLSLTGNAWYLRHTHDFERSSEV